VNSGAPTPVVEDALQWTIEQVARALGATAPRALNQQARLSGASIDSRTIRSGELFFAISGPRFDGHEFVVAALESAAAGAVVQHGRVSAYPESIHGKLFAVPDTLVALQQLARAVRRAWGKRLAAVTGSVGKTTTKEILASLLRSRFRILKSEGNLNNEYGLPLALLRLEPDTEAAVVELGMSHAGEIRALARIAEPQVGIVTRIAPVHLEYFSSVDDIARAKRELIEGLVGVDTLAVLNADDERVARFAEKAPGRVLTFGFGASAQFRAENLEDRGAQGSTFDLVAPEGTARMTLPLPGRHSIANALAAVAAASAWGIGLAEAAHEFPRMSPGEMRGRLLHFAKGFAVINDSYNSNPVALAAMVELLARTSGYRRRIVAAGQMLELGVESARLHHTAGFDAARTNPSLLIAVGGDAAHFAQGAIEGGMDAQNVKFFETSADAGAFLTETVEQGDLVLVKGSRGTKMEKIIEALVARHALANSGTQETAMTRH
jgi:UDP-N-acetylmuramoyl-tripeptide--D-alanyl-D-alanine ligase